MAPRIHPTAIVEAGAVLANDVEIGPLAVVGPHVELCAGVSIGAHATVIGCTRIGSRTRVFPYACLGGEPQIKDFTGAATRLEIGRDNVIREHTSIHVGSPEGDGCTRIGDDNLIMNAAHIGHDCQIGSCCIVASFCGLAGHVRVEDHAVLGAYTGVHQHARVGESVMAASNAKLSQDAPPFSMVAGDGARVVGINLVGLRRRGFDADTIKTIKHAFHLLFNSRTRFQDSVKRVREEIEGSAEVDRLLRFLEESSRGFCR